MGGVHAIGYGLQRAILFFLFLVCATVSGQHITLSGGSGYGLYQLSELKNLQTDAAQLMLPLKVAPVVQFPDYLTVVAAMEYTRNDRDYFGIGVAFCTTGARNHLKDYSGEYKLDMILNGYQLGLQYRRMLPMSDDLHFYFGCKSGIVLSTLKMNEKFTIYNAVNNSETYAFTSRMVFIEPVAGFVRSLGSRFSIDLGVGYVLDPGGKLLLSDNPDHPMKNISGKEVHANWSGFRLSAMLGFHFSKKTETQQK